MTEENNSEEEVIDLNNIEEDTLATKIMQKRNIPYTLKIEKIDAENNKVYCRSAWSNHILYIFKENEFYLESEL